MEEQVFNELDKNLISFLSVFVTLRRHDECFISINHLSLVGVLRRQPSVWLNETTSSLNSLDFTQLKNCSSPKKKYIDIPIPHSNIYDRWAIQECFTRIFLQKIVLFHIDNETYVERWLLLHWLGHENFVRRRSNDVNLSSIGKKTNNR